MSLFTLPDRTTVKTVGIVIMVSISFAIVSVNDDLPSRVVVPWAKGDCFWLNGTIMDKEARDDGLTTDYRFYVQGTLDNTTEFNSIVHGTKLEYEIMPIGLHYEGHICDTVTLREAVINGTVEIIDWVI